MAAYPPEAAAFIVTKSSGDGTSLLENCSGDWSGSIGWFDILYDDNQDAVGILCPRKENRERNMRLSFHPSPETENVANWVVYHARGQGIKEEVLLEKHASENSPLEKKQLFYGFEGGILGRTGLDFQMLLVIEHGYWDQGTRRTVVLAYGEGNKTLTKICFVQQEKQENGLEFDVSSTDPSHVPVLPNKPSSTLEQLQDRWRALQLKKAESILSDGTRQVLKNSNALNRLLVGITDNDDGERILRVVVPNNVVLACPFYFDEKSSFRILMACQTKSDVVQVVEFHFVHAYVERVTASYYCK